VSAIPPTWLGSIVQGHAAQTRALEQQDRESAEQARRSGSDSFTRGVQDVIHDVEGAEPSDPDASGAGGQGRAFLSDVPEEQADQPRQETPQGRLDIQA
jgi:hypothetical protein